MSKIQVMSEHLSNLIAAGEVVDRPMNIVKECIENSLDAHATSVEIEVFEGGITGLIITDNGDGMDQQDALLAFSHHATSKLKNEEDLFRIMTMGFRGEALASIAAVAQVDLQTNNGKESTHVRFEYGKCTLQEEFSCPRGTRIEVRGLFSHTPARLKYLKKANYEFSVIAEAVNKLALSHPDIRFMLKHDGRVIFQTSGKGDQKEVLYQMYGREAAQNCLEFSADGYDFQISGLAVQPKINRASRNFIYININSRIVRSWPVTNAVIEGYREFLPRDRYPIFLINIQVDPQLIDVNVHPNKMEVRISKEEFLSQLIINTIENLFYDQLDTPSLDDSLLRKQNRIKETPVQEKLELKYPNRGPKEQAYSVSETVQMMNPNKQPGSDLLGDPHFDQYAANSGRNNQEWKNENEYSEQALRKEIRRQFNGSIPSGSPYTSRKNPQKLSDYSGSDTGIEQPESQEIRNQVSDRINPETSVEKSGPESGSESFWPEDNEARPAVHSLQRNQTAESVRDKESFTQTSQSDSQVEEYIPGEVSEERRKQLNESDSGMDFFDHLVVIGQLKDSYILCENPQGLVIIDQHAAQERCNFERLQREMLKPTEAIQPRMIPLLIDVRPDLFARLDRINELTEPFGLSFEAFGQSQFILRQEPLWFSQIDQKAFIDDMFAVFVGTQNIDIAYMRRHMIATMACHSSIRFNRPLSRDEMEKVIWDLQQCRHPYHCPHGRPTVLKLSDAFLRKEFERS